MRNEKTPVKQFEASVDDFHDLWKRRKALCILFLLIMVLPSLFVSYREFFVVPSLKSSILKLQEENQKMEKQRDKAELQLAPFLATAQARFPDAPPDKRLELLLERMERAIQDVTNAANYLGKPRVLSPSLISNLVSRLKTPATLKAQIVSPVGDSESLSLALQIKDIFSQANWPVVDDRVHQVVFNTPRKGLLVMFSLGDTLPPSLPEVIYDLEAALGQPKSSVFCYKQHLQKGLIEIVVGSKP